MDELDAIQTIRGSLPGAPQTVVDIGGDDCCVVNVADFDKLFMHSAVITFNESPSPEAVARFITEEVSRLPDESTHLGILSFFGMDEGPNTSVQNRIAGLHQAVPDVYLLGGDTNEWREEVLAVCILHGGASDINANCNHVAEVNFPYQYLVASLDSINSTPIGKDYLPNWYEQLGRYTSQCNISDILATGGIPVGLQYFVGIPENKNESIDFTPADLDSVKNGIRQEMKRAGTDNFGIVRTATSHFLMGATAIGGAKNLDQIRLRSGAVPGDYVVLLGEVGGFAAASYGFEQGIDMSEDIRTEFLGILAREPPLPINQSAKLTNHRLGNGGIDISDGPGVDLPTLASVSGVGLEIYADWLPILPAVRQFAQDCLNVPPTSLFWTFGGDWATIVTIEPEKWEQIQPKIEGPATPIGYVTEDSELLYHTGDGTVPLPQWGYKQFQGKELTFFDLFELYIEQYLSRTNADAVPAWTE